MTQPGHAPLGPPSVASFFVRCDLCQRPRGADDRGWLTILTHYHETRKPIVVTSCPDCTKLILQASPIDEPPVPRD
jgi:hypothetical protein